MKEEPSCPHNYKAPISVSSFIGTDLTAEVLDACNKLDIAIATEPISKNNEK